MVPALPGLESLERRRIVRIQRICGSRRPNSLRKKGWAKGRPACSHRSCVAGPEWKPCPEYLAEFLCSVSIEAGCRLRLT